MTAFLGGQKSKATKKEGIKFQLWCIFLTVLGMDEKTKQTCDFNAFIFDYYFEEC